MNNEIKTYKDLIVWQRAMEVVVEVYKITENYPKEELYNLVSHTRKTAISIPSNIAEGRRRGSQKEFRKFLLISFGSSAELETQIEIAKRLSFGNGLNFEEVDGLLEETMKMLNKLIYNLRVEN